MANSIVGGLFGVTPYDVASQRINDESQLATNFAQLTPQQQGQYGMYAGGAGLVRAATGLLGAEDPRLQQAKQMQQVKDYIAQNGIDINSPEGLAQAAQYANSIGAAEGAMYLGQQAQQMRASASKMKLEEAKAYAEVKKADAEKFSNTARMLVEAGYTPGTPEFQAAMQQAAIAEIQGKTSPKTVVNVSQQQESEFSKELGKIQGKQMESAYNTRNAAVKTLDTLTKMSTLNDQQLISGSFSGPRAATANFLNTVGLASDSDAKRLSNTQQFEKVAGDLVLANIKQLGYNPSNADVTFLNKTLPNLETSPQARKDLINWMGTKAQGSITEVKNMEAYALKNKSLNGYTPAVPNFNPTGGTQAPSKTYKGKALDKMTPAELAAARAELSQ